MATSEEWELRWQESDRRFYRNINEIRLQWGLSLITHPSLQAEKEEREWELRWQESDRRFYRNINEIRLQWGLPLITHPSLQAEKEESDRKNQEQPPVEATSADEVEDLKSQISENSDEQEITAPSPAGVDEDLNSTEFQIQFESSKDLSRTIDQEDDQGRPIACQEAILTNSGVLSVNFSVEIEEIEAPIVPVSPGCIDRELELQSGSLTAKSYRVLEAPVADKIQIEAPLADVNQEVYVDEPFQDDEFVEDPENQSKPSWKVIFFPSEAMVLDAAAKRIKALPDVSIGSIRIEPIESRWANFRLNASSCWRIFSAQKVFVEMSVHKEIPFGSANMVMGHRNWLFDPGGCSSRDCLSGKVKCGVELSSGMVVVVDRHRETVGYQVYDRGKQPVPTCLSMVLMESGSGLSKSRSLQSTHMSCFWKNCIGMVEDMILVFDNVGCSSFTGVAAHGSVFLKGQNLFPFDRGRDSIESTDVIQVQSRLVMKFVFDPRTNCVVQDGKPRLAVTLIFDPGGNCLFGGYFY